MGARSRPTGCPARAAGAKRLELTQIGDPATAMSALQAGEQDYRDTPPADLVPTLQRDPSITVATRSTLPASVMLQMNHRQPPLNDVKVRQAPAIDQKQLLRAAVNDPARIRPFHSYRCCGTPHASEEGAEIIKTVSIPKPRRRWRHRATRARRSCCWTRAKAPTRRPLCLALILAFGIGVPCGVLASRRRGGAWDRALRAYNVARFSIPVIVCGCSLAYVFATRLHWLPVQGSAPPFAGASAFRRTLLLPALTLSILYSALIATVPRSAMLDVLGKASIVEVADRASLFGRPRHPDALALLSAALPPRWGCAANASC